MGEKDEADSGASRPISDAPAAGSDGSVIHKQGWARKQGGIVPTWKRRWFVLRGSILRYYAREAGEEKGQIDVKDAQKLERAPECSHQPALKIEVPGRNYFMVCETMEEVDDWIETMNTVCFPAYLDE
jgi:RAC serine/threonine-protein kinase/non-specific serine/threonine protein kinase/protein-serine/threonine kinase